MSESVPVIIDEDKCIKCMECVRTCPSSTLYEKDGKVNVTKLADSWCFGCAHCMGVCPEDAVTVTRYKDRSEKVPASEVKIDPEILLDFLRSRRSTRLFKPEQVKKSDLEYLVNAARYAPSGHNDQTSEFTVITGERVNQIRRAIIDEFSLIVNSLPDDPELRVKRLGKLVPKSFINMLNPMIDTMKNLIIEIEKGGRDRIFWGAPAIIIITADKKYKSGSGVVENSTLTADYVMLMAEAMNLGTCSLGILLIAMNFSRKVAKLCRIPKNQRARYALAVGKKDTNFKYLVPRDKPRINFVE